MRVNLAAGGLLLLALVIYISGCAKAPAVVKPVKRSLTAEAKYTAKFYPVGGVTPILSEAITPSCGQPKIISGSNINPTHIRFDDPADLALDCRSDSAITSLPRGTYGSLYEGSVERCDSEGCSESGRVQFCVGVPTRYQSYATCKAAIDRATWEYLIYCLLFRVCQA